MPDGFLRIPCEALAVLTDVQTCKFRNGYVAYSPTLKKAISEQVLQKKLVQCVHLLHLVYTEMHL